MSCIVPFDRIHSNATHLFQVLSVVTIYMELKLRFIIRISNARDERIVDQGLIGDRSWKPGTEPGIFVWGGGSCNTNLFIKTTLQTHIYTHIFFIIYIHIYTHVNLGNVEFRVFPFSEYFLIVWARTYLFIFHELVSHTRVSQFELGAKTLLSKPFAITY